MTNRKDLLDPALLRSERLEVHIEIPLPSEEGRYAILKIHSKDSPLSDDVNLKHIAELTKNYSGAELKGVVKAASSLALSEYVSNKDGQVTLAKNADEMRLRQEHFITALKDVHPVYGLTTNTILGNVKYGIFEYSQAVHDLRNKLLHAIKSAMPGLTQAILVSGMQGSGLTALCCDVAVQSHVPYIDIISSSDLIELSEFGRIGKLKEAITKAMNYPHSILILDSLDLLIDYSSYGPRFLNSVLNALRWVFHVIPQGRNKVVVIGNTTERNFIEDQIPGFYTDSTSFTTVEVNKQGISRTKEVLKYVMTSQETIESILHLTRSYIQTRNTLYAESKLLFVEAKEDHTHESIKHEVLQRISGEFETHVAKVILDMSKISFNQEIFPHNIPVDDLDKRFNEILQPFDSIPLPTTIQPLFQLIGEIVTRFYTDTTSAILRDIDGEGHTITSSLDRYFCEMFKDY